MQDKLSKVVVALLSACFVILSVPVKAAEYNPGVQVGYWVEYKNLASSGPYNPQDFNVTEWMRMEVINVVGRNVTVHTSQMLKDGTFLDGYDYVFDVDTGGTDRSADPSNLWNNYFIIAGNLTENSDTHLTLRLDPGAFPMLVNKTETRDLLGTNRAVNKVNYSESLEGYYDYQFYAMYDQATGMLLELNISTTSQTTPSGNEVLSFSAADINTKPRPPDYALVYTGVAFAAFIVVAAALVLVRRRKTRAEKPVQEASNKKHTE
jgi:hypothetical protein